jgi:pimeloyl-ACP methyl ester carboxylesterase
VADSFQHDFVETPDGARLYYQVRGEGEPPVVLLDGLGCDGFAWKYLAPSLQKTHRVLRWHYRGHGRSTVAKDPQRLGMHFNCEDLALVMDRVGIPSAVVFGHSMGVQVALEFHRRFAERVLGLGLVCGSYGNPLDTLHDDNKMRQAFPFVRQLVELVPKPIARLTRFLLSTELAVQFTLTTELNRKLLKREDLLPYFEHLSCMDPLVFVRTLASLADHTAWDHLPHVNVPTLIFGGERDRFTPMWLSRRMADAIPDSELVVLPDGSHTAPLEHPERVEQAVASYFARHFAEKPRRARSGTARRSAARAPAAVLRRGGTS